MPTNDQHVCHRCIAEYYLRGEIRRRGVVTRCSFCGTTAHSISLETLALRAGRAFIDFYVVADDWSDVDLDGALTPHSAGESRQVCLEELMMSTTDVAAAVERWLSHHPEALDDPYGRFTPHDTRSFEYMPPTSGPWSSHWDHFAWSCKHEARFVSPEQRSTLSVLFGNLRLFGSSAVKTLRPGEPFSVIYRAREAQSARQMGVFASTPTVELGPPPPDRARPGRMNAGGISVFYGAFSKRVAVSELRPRVGASIVVARFQLRRPLRVLDFRRVTYATQRDSVFKAGFEIRESKRQFLSMLASQISRPVQPHDELLDYVPTQILAEYLGITHGLDGLIYPSAQFEGDRQQLTEDDPPARPPNAVTDEDCNVVLFHHASRIEGGPELRGPLHNDDREPSLAITLGPPHSRDRAVTLAAVERNDVVFREEVAYTTEELDNPPF